MSTASTETELQVIVTKANLPQDRQDQLLDSFAPYWSRIQEVKAASQTIVVTSPEQIREMANARKARLALRDIRLDIEKTRKSLKEDALATGKAIDGLANVLKYLIEPEEARLEDQEKFAERLAAAQAAERALKRHRELTELGVDSSGFNLGTMTDDAYHSLLENSRIAKQHRLEAEAKAKAEAEQREVEAKAERQRLEAENKKLREQAERDRVLRQQAEAARVAAERQAEAEAKAKADAEAKAERQRKADARKAAKAPDAEKINALADKILVLCIESPTLADKDLQKKVNDLLLTVDARLRDLANE